MGKRQAATDAPLMSELNTTPLIDVMLVLLIMFIVTIPIQTHAVKLDLPTGKPPVRALEPVLNKIVITADDRLLWNGEAITPEQLRLFLDLTTQLDPVPELQIQPVADARYETVDEVLVIAKRAGVTKLGFVGNEAYARDMGATADGE